jgi:integrase
LQSYIRSLGFASFRHLIAASPQDVRAHWNSDVLPHATPSQANAARAVLHSLCNLAIGAWSPGFAHLVRALRGPKVDTYRVVRTGACFVPLDQQALIVNHIDDTCVLLSASAAAVSSVELRDICVLVVSYQYAFRPGQIARIELADVRVFSTGAVHIAVIAAKQRDQRKRTRVTRRIKREWAPLFIEYVRRREAGTIPLESGVPDRLLFGLTPKRIRQVIKTATEGVTGQEWTPTELRHTAAQRLADAGVAHVALAEFMVHASHRTANVYFDTSPTQAQRVNEALAISPTYANVAKVARTRTIDMDALLGLPAEKQIGGAPHGISISGIGGCGLGQSLCPKNPVLSCYTCINFLPLGETDIHEQVLDQLRPVVIEFAAASRNNRQSPAYVQLRTTLDGVRRVIEGLKAADDPGTEEEADS